MMSENISRGRKPKTRTSGKSARSPRTPVPSLLARLFGSEDAGPQRLAKAMAAAGLCSRRDAESWIAAGRVEVNGRQQLSPALNVTADDEIRVDGTPINPPDTPRLWRYYKPRGLIVSHRDEQGRKTIFEHLPDHLPRLISIGRLDLDSEGLILLTNNGDLARHLELPDTGWTRKYRVRVRGQVDSTKLAALRDGITIDGVSYRGVLAQLDRQAASNAWLTIALKEGKNREIRRIMDHLGYSVSRLIRISYGPFTLNTLEEGSLEEVRPAILRDQLGLPRITEAEKNSPSRPDKGSPAKAPGRSSAGSSSGSGPGSRRNKPGNPQRGDRSNADHQRKAPRRHPRGT
ncbi:pseudouridine synthase [Alphaproteobacteria bacterium LSUCC0684]